MSESSIGPESLYRHIVVGVDGSEPSAAALEHASRLAEAFDARLTVVLAWFVPPMYTNSAEPVDPESDAQRALSDTLKGTFPSGVPEHVTAMTRNGPAASVLIDQSRNADLIVVGSRGHGGFAGLLMGSVSTQCAAHAYCPVLVHH